RHPARPLLLQHVGRGMARGDRRAPERLVLRRARRRAAFQVAAVGLLRPHDLDLGFGRQSRPGELRRGQARHRRPFEVDRARHGQVQRALELHLALRLEPDDRVHSNGHPGSGGQGGKTQVDGNGEDRAARRLSGFGRSKRGDRPDLRGARERDLPHVAEPAAALGASLRGMDAGNHRRARHSLPPGSFLQAGSLAGRVFLGPAVKRVLLSDSIAPAGEEALRREVEVVHAPDSDLATLRKWARDVDGVLTRSKLPDDLFDAAPRVRAIVVHGTGTDLVPVAAATANGVMVANLPGINAHSVAEYCAMAMLMLARNIFAITGTLRSKTWDEARVLGSFARELAGMTVGIVGVGEIGSRLAKIARNGFGMKVLGHQRRLDRLPAEASASPLRELIQSSDFLVLACPLTPQTRYLMNRETLALMK